MVKKLYEVRNRSGDLILENATSGEIKEELHCTTAQINNATVRRHIAMLLEDRILETEHPGDSRAYRIKDTKIVMVKEKKTNGNDNSK